MWAAFRDWKDCRRYRFRAFRYSAIWPDLALPYFQSNHGTLSIVSKMGVVLFMFVIGIELDAAVVRKKARQSLVISGVSIALPFALGSGLAFYLYRNYAAPGAAFSGFALFMGIAMSITAFPVLARILRERGLETNRLGIIALSCAAAYDVAAWCILAAITAVIQSRGLSGLGLTKCACSCCQLSFNSDCLELEAKVF